MASNKDSTSKNTPSSADTQGGGRQRSSSPATSSSSISTSQIGPSVWVPGPEPGISGRYVELAPVNPAGAGEWRGQAPEYKVGITPEGKRIEYVSEPKKEEQFITVKQTAAAAAPSKFNPIPVKGTEVGYKLTPQSVGASGVMYSVEQNLTGQVVMGGYRDWESIAVKLNNERFGGQQAVVASGDGLAPNPAISGAGKETISKMITEIEKNIKKNNAYVIPERTLSAREARSVSKQIETVGIDGKNEIIPMPMSQTEGEPWRLNLAGLSTPDVGPIKLKIIEKTTTSAPDFSRYGVVGSIPYLMAEKEYKLGQEYESGNILALPQQFALSIPLSFYRGVLTTEETLWTATHGGLVEVGRKGLGEKVISELVIPATTFRFFPSAAGKIESVIPRVISSPLARQFTGLTITGAVLNPETYINPIKGFQSSALLAGSFTGLSRGMVKVGEFITPPRFVGETAIVFKPQLENVQEGIIFGKGKVQYPFGIEKNIDLSAKVDLFTVSTKYEIPYVEAQKLIAPASDYFRAGAPAELRQGRYEHLFGKTKLQGAYVSEQMITTGIEETAHITSITQAIKIASKLPDYRVYIGLKGGEFETGGGIELYKSPLPPGFPTIKQEYYYGGIGKLKSGKTTTPFKFFGGGAASSYGKESSGLTVGYSSALYKKSFITQESLSVFQSLERPRSMQLLDIKIPADYAKEYIGQTFSVKTEGGASYQKALKIMAKDFGLKTIEPINARPTAKTKARISLFDPTDLISKFKNQEPPLERGFGSVKIPKTNVEISRRIKDAINKVTGVSEVKYTAGLLNVKIDTGYKSGTLLQSFRPNKLSGSVIRETGFDKPLHGSKNAILLPGEIYEVAQKETGQIRIEKQINKIINPSIEKSAISMTQESYLEDINDAIFKGGKFVGVNFGKETYKNIGFSIEKGKETDKIREGYGIKSIERILPKISIRTNERYGIKINEPLKLTTVNMTYSELSIPKIITLETTLPKITTITTTEIIGEPEKPWPEVPKITRIPGPGVPPFVLVVPYIQPEKKEKKKTRKTKQIKGKTKYVPSVAGIMLGKREGKIKSRYTGYEIRGLPKNIRRLARGVF